MPTPWRSWRAGILRPASRLQFALVPPYPIAAGWLCENFFHLSVSSAGSLPPLLPPRGSIDREPRSTKEGIECGRLREMGLRGLLPPAPATSFSPPIQFRQILATSLGNTAFLLAETFRRSVLEKPTM